MSATAVMLLTMELLSKDVHIDKRGKVDTHERIVHLQSVIPYAGMQACENGRNEFDLSVGAYQQFKLPTRIVSAICIDTERGTNQ
jgi:hypothetical protein